MDLSFNETNYEIESLEIGSGLSVETYSLASLIAEKYRALFQQEKRNRYRAQDVYDLAFLIRNYRPEGHEMLVSIKEGISASCLARDIVATRESIDQQVVRDFAKHDYQALASTVKGKLPAFEATFKTVSEFYHSLPW